MRLAKLLTSAKMHKSVLTAGADRFKNQPPSIWVTINELVAKEKPLNMGQGFQDYKPLSHVTESLAAVANDSAWQLHQYTRAFGHQRLVQALAKLYSPFHQRELNPMTDILISVGGYGSLFTTINAFINPGDEVIIIEPFFDCYAPMVDTVGGKSVFIPLRPPKTTGGGSSSSADWKLLPDELESKASDKTKMIIINTPNNPLGKVFTEEELKMIADFAVRHNLLVVSDEVYEWLVYPPYKHVKIATFPGMWERTITIGSVGKTFGVTGWKMGWSIAPSHLIKPMQTAHQNCVYTCPTPLQEAIARSLEIEIERLNTPQSFWPNVTNELLAKRDRIGKELEALGMHPTYPEGGYFMMVDISGFDFPESDFPGDSPRDVRFNEWMVKNKGVAAIPPTVFYSQGNKYIGEQYLRLCFIKEDATLDKFIAILKKWGGEISSKKCNAANS